MRLIGLGMNFNDVDLNLIRTFDVLMQEKSVTRTAERLYRTQSAISYSLSKLRDLFRDELFVRDGTVMRPTALAIEIYPEVSGALASIRLTLDRRRSFDPAQSRRNYRIGLTDYHSTVFVPDLIRKFSSQAPHASFNIIPLHNSDISGMLAAGELDCALTGTGVQGDNQIGEVELGRYQLLCAAWSGSELVRGAVTLESYLSRAHIQVSSDGLSEGLADQALRKLGLKRHVLVTVANYLLLPWALRGTELISHCGSGLAQIFDASSEITFFEPPLDVPDVSLSLVFAKQLATDPATRWLLDLIGEIHERTKSRTSPPAGSSASGRARGRRGSHRLAGE
jgi:DNA-binding transcriptional LysR family regulator